MQRCPTIDAFLVITGRQRSAKRWKSPGFVADKQIVLERRIAQTKTAEPRSIGVDSEETIVDDPHPRDALPANLVSHARGAAAVPVKNQLPAAR